MAKRSHRELTLAGKIQLIKSKDSTSASHRELAQQFGIGKTTVSDILKKKEDYLKQYEETLPTKRKRKERKTAASDINELMFRWFMCARQRGIPISGPLIQEKARQYAEELEVSNFSASNGWLASFKTRHAIKAFRINGESLDVNPDTVKNWKDRLQDITAGFRSENIFNCDETGLFFRALPDKTLSTKGSKCFGGKCSKERLTVMLCASSTGEKLKPLVIGTAKKPRCFKNVDVSELPVQWEAQSKAWMNGFIFAKWITHVDRCMARQGRHILLFLDNAPCHPKEDLHLSNITLKFYPANCTSKLQPLDLGIIRCFKALYRKQLLRFVLAKMDSSQGSGGAMAKCVTVLNAVDWIARAWNEVKELTIRHCFAAAGPDQAESESIEPQDSMPELQSLLELGDFNDCSADDFNSADADLPSCEAPGDNWEEDLLEDTRRAQSNDNDSDDEEDSCDEADSPGSHLTHRNVLGMLEQIRDFAMCKDSDYLTPINALKSLTEKKIISSMTQTTLNSYFQ